MLSRLSSRLAVASHRNGLSFTRRFTGSLAETSTPNTPIEINEKMAPFRSYAPETGYIWSSRFGTVTVPEMTLDEYVWKDVQKWHKKIAIVCGVTGRKYTYGKLRDHCAALAIRLRNEFNLKPGDVVAISMPNVPEYAIVALGVLEAGLTLSTVNPIYTADEQAKQFAMIDAKMVFSVVESIPIIQNAREKAGKTTMPIVAIKTHKLQTIPEGILNFSDLIDANNIDFSLLGPKVHRSEDVCIIPFSSGTTGLPKGVMLTHSNITSNLEMLLVDLCDGQLTLPTTNDFQELLPCVVPFFHAYGFTFLLMAKLALGCKLVTLPRFEPKTFVSVLTEYKSTFLVVAPPLFLFLTNDDRVTKHHLSHTRTITCAASVLGAEDAERFIASKGRNVEVCQMYGMTEISPFALMKHRQYTNHATIGWPMASTEAKIVALNDPQNIGLDAEVEGELLVRSPSVMKGYLNNQEATNATVAYKDWMRTGDIAKYDSNGDFYLLDRVKELIKVKGFQVAPAEIEVVLRSHPKILEACVVGVKHVTSGEVPRGYVVVRDGERLTEEEVQAFIETKCAKYKWLTGGVRFIDSVPKTSTGKLLRREIIRLYDE